MDLLNIVLDFLGFPELSHLFARLWGTLFVVLFSAIVCNRKCYYTLLATLDQHYLAIVLSGMIALLAGVVSIIFHTIWAISWIGAITLLGWGSFIYGAIAILRPQAVSMSVKWLVTTHPTLLSYFAGLAIVGGVYLCYEGLRETEASFAPPIPEQISLENRS